MRFNKKFGFNPENNESEDCGFTNFGLGGRFRHGFGGNRGGRGRGHGVFGDEFFGRMGGFRDINKLKGKLLSSEEMHLIILDLMAKKEIYGYEIIKDVEGLTNGVYSPSPGMIYPLLSYITELNHATSEMEGNRKRFKITEDGIKFLGENQEQLTQTLEKIKTFSERMAEVNSRIAEDETSEKAWGRGNGGMPDFETLAQFHSIRGELRKALYSRRAAPKEEKQRVLEILRRAINEINGEIK